MNDATPTYRWNESAPSLPGKDCQCEARNKSECGCDADWTPSEIYRLREERNAARARCASWIREWRSLRDLCRQLDEEACDRLRERNEALEALRMIHAADWKTAGELRGMARVALEKQK